jgi:hypothetical protein
MKNKGSPLSLGILVLAILFSLSLAFNMVQFYTYDLPSNCPIQEECAPLPAEKVCPPAEDLAPVVSTANTNTLNYVSSFEGGTLYKTKDGKYDVLDLHGTYREMGRQYGYLMKDEMQAMYNETKADLVRRGMSEPKQFSESNKIYQIYPQRFKEIIIGMSETSGLTLDEQIAYNGAIGNLFNAFFFQATPGDPAIGCSGSAFWSDYSKDGKLYFGRNWDASQDLMAPYVKYLTLAVYHPEGGGNTVANLEFAGAVYTETAMNDKGIFIELNNGGQSDPKSYPERLVAVAALLEFAFDYSTIPEIESSFETTRASDAYLVQVADSSSAYSFEWATFGVHKRSENVSGLLVAYNSFVPPYPENWAVNPEPTLDVRRANLLALANSPEYKGRMDVEKYKEFLSVRIEDGGALTSGTNFQVIAVPADSLMWIRGIGYSDWSEVDLKPLFEQ